MRPLAALGPRCSLQLLHQESGFVERTGLVLSPAVVWYTLLHEPPFFSFEPRLLGPHILAAPFDLAVRCYAVSNVPQSQFNDDSVWHDFAPDRAALKAGPWFPMLWLYSANERLSDHFVHRPKPTKSAGKTIKAPAALAAAAAADGVGAGAAADDDDDCAPSPQIKKARDAAEGSK